MPCAIMKTFTIKLMVLQIIMMKALGKVKNYGLEHGFDECWQNFV